MLKDERLPLDMIPLLSYLRLSPSSKSVTPNIKIPKRWSRAASNMVTEYWPGIAGLGRLSKREMKAQDDTYEENKKVNTI